MNRQRSFNTVRHHSRQSSAGKSIITRLFPPELQNKNCKAINMNDSRRQLHRDPTKNFQRSQQQSHLFQKGVRKIQLQLSEKPQRSLPRKFHNKSSLNINSSVSSEIAQIKPQGLRRIKLETVQPKLSSRKHYEPPTARSQEDTNLNFVVPAVNPSTNSTESKQIIIKIGRTYPRHESETENKPPEPQKVVINQKKHFAKGEKEIVKGLMTDRSLIGQMDFKHDYYRAEERMPKQKVIRVQQKLFDERKAPMSSRLFR